MSRVLFENRPALYFCNYKENKKNWYTYVGYYKLMILYSLWSNIFIIRIVVIIIGNKKKLNSIFDTESKIIQFMGRNKYIITKIKCWPVFKQDPMSLFIVIFYFFINRTFFSLRQNDSADEYDMDAARVTATSSYLIDQLEPPPEYATGRRPAPLRIMTNPVSSQHNNLDYDQDGARNQYNASLGTWFRLVFQS